MKIKRYSAASMRAALALVRAEQGPDAVILSSRRGEEGIEVIAAVDYDEALFADANRQRSAPSIAPAAADAAPAPTARTPVAAAPRPLQAAHTQATAHAQATARAQATVRAPQQGAATLARPVATQPAPVRPAAAADPSYGAMQRELRDLRQLLETGLAGMTWSDKRLREPLQARVLEELSAMDIAPDIAMALAAMTPRRTSLKNPSHIPLALLVKHLPVVSDLTCVTGGITAVVGPTGAGKTTTIAKLAARWCMLHGSQDLALVSTDGYRIGAREQLMTYARILGAPMHAANNGQELARVLERLKSKKLILIDTAGMGPRDVRLTEQLATLKLGAARARVLLALPAQGEGQALEEIVRAFARVAPAACVITKVDEAASLGGAISAVLRHKLKIAYVCNGQRVPEDLHAAHQKRVWLIRAALQLKERLPRARDEASLARAFGRVAAHA
ncbi:MAG TPA: flagellar biosynthesis protein FlhF [Steroidobacteraceae bacterium]|jgi:flagellar biosynthesis protein FlhF|nr:flagellar biosynthesis protein FlhF [Steroidobacteraceae bacterium]